MQLMFKRSVLVIGAITILTALSASATDFTKIDQMSGWSSCGSCAGIGGNGPKVPYSMKEGVAVPSMDGRSVQFNLGGTKPYGAAIWWKQLGAHNATHHFVYDLYFYIKNPAASQALEFDINQSVNGRKWIFGTQCNIKGSHTWDVWDTPNHRWVHTGIGCSAPPAYKWNHLTIEAERVNGKAHFISITLNGKKGYVNKYFGSKSGPAGELNVAFQMDGNSTQTDYSVWLDNVSLTAN